MINNSTNNSKLDEAVKTTLDNYEAPFDAGDWDRMESMLNAAPKQGSFKWSGSLTAVVVSIAVLGGSYFIYDHYSTGSTKVIPEPAVIENKTITPPPAASPKITPPPAVNAAVTNEAITQPAEEPAVVVKENVVAKPIATELKTKVEKLPGKEEKAKTKKEAPFKELTEEDRTAPQKVMGMGNEPIFGDMLDSSRGIIGETREREETKKAAKASKNTPVGWKNILPNVDIDSLRKYRQQRDSVKVQ